MLMCKVSGSNVISYGTNEKEKFVSMNSDAKLDGLDKRCTSLGVEMNLHACRCGFSFSKLL